MDEFKNEKLNMMKAYIDKAVEHFEQPGNDEVTELKGEGYLIFEINQNKMNMYMIASLNSSQIINLVHRLIKQADMMMDKLAKKSEELRDKQK